MKAGMIMVLGEITTSATINYEAIVRDTLRDIGFDNPNIGLDYKSVNIIIAVEEQSQGHSLERTESLDQCVVFGYASNEAVTVLTPLTHLLALNLANRLTEARKSGALEWLLPYGTVLVTCEYSLLSAQIIPQRVHTVVITIQQNNAMSSHQLREGLMNEIVRKTIPANYVDDDTIYHLAPVLHVSAAAARYVTGVTGRKISAETYGGWIPHGGCFSGKDATNMERSGAYAARWVAKSLVNSHLCHRALIQLAFAPGVAYPISVHVDSFGSGSSLSGKSDSELLDIVKSNFDLHPSSIVRDLQLDRPIMFDSAKFGHFAPALQTAAWETPKTLNF
mmetsp:Transcript_26553/g.81636  ORF Transcript_26553/g.81636 Transcript_26553/m.81636 type:complete len:335 (-) Transcript_26553:956-1960(-)